MSARSSTVCSRWPTAARTTRSYSPCSMPLPPSAAVRRPSPALGPSAPTAVATTPPLAPAPFPARWVHETTNDDKFTGREEERARLDRWVRDEAVRAIGVCAVGGTGKTALVGHWLKATRGWRSRPLVGLFAWSLYQNRDSAIFLEAFLEWAHETFGTPTPKAQTDSVAAALAVLQQRLLVVVLDGLEVLQKGPEETRHGAFIDGALREFLGGLCAREHGSLAVLTSRFIFADLERHLGTAFHQLQLPGLAPEQGAALLAELGVRGVVTDRAEVSRRLEGHPLGLRVFAEAMADAQRDQPGAFLDEAFRTGCLPADAPLAGKLKRLLVFYEHQLPPTQVQLLSVIALFRTPVAEDTILRLARELFAKQGREALPDDTALAAELRRLHTRGMLSREPLEGGHGYACHPILRDHFRAVLLSAGADTAQRAADWLTGQPSRESSWSVKEIEPVLLAIELLLDMGVFEAADELYRVRLENGNVFRWIPALPEGLRCALGFVQDEGRRQQEKLSLAMSWYLNEVGLLASLCGDFERAARSYADANTFRRDGGTLQNQAILAVSLGRLTEAEDRAAEALGLDTEALGLDREVRRVRRIRDSYVLRGWVRALSGQVRVAAEDCAGANALEKEDAPHGDELYSIRGIWWAELLIRSGHPALAARRTRANLRICEGAPWKDDRARCHWALGVCALAEERLDDAEAALRQAEPILHRGQLLFELARWHVTAGAVALARQQAGGAQHRAAEALALAQPHGMRLVHADALVLRGRARLLEAERLNRDQASLSAPGASARPDALARALDDAEDAFPLASECGYTWAERDALALQADTHDVLAKAHHEDGRAAAAARHRAAAQRARADADALAARLRLTDDDLTQADAKATAWLKAWEYRRSI
jgi:hypothetical protein